MVHGEGIAALTPRLSRPGVALVDVQKVANPNYLFVTLDIAADAKPGSFDIEFLDGDGGDDGDVVAVRHPFRLDAREPGSAARRSATSAWTMTVMVSRLGSASRTVSRTGTATL